MAGDAQVHRLDVLGQAAVLEHALVLGVDLDLRLVRRLRPAVHRGLDTLHGEVRALDDAQLDRRPAAGRPRNRPRRGPPRPRGRVGRYRWGTDPAANRLDPRSPEPPREAGPG